MLMVTFSFYEQLPALPHTVKQEKQPSGRRVIFMPNWLIKQLKQAFLYKNRREIRWLNQCWFSYHEKQQSQT